MIRGFIVSQSVYGRDEVGGWELLGYNRVERRASIIVPLQRDIGMSLHADADQRSRGCFCWLVVRLLFNSVETLAARANLRG